LDLPFDDEVEDLGDRKAGFDQRKELLVENQEVLLSDPAPGGEGNTEGQVGAAGSDLKNIVAFCFELVPIPVGVPMRQLKVATKLPPPIRDGRDRTTIPSEANKYS
jgi:hypothetical protein